MLLIILLVLKEGVVEFRNSDLVEIRVGGEDVRTESGGPRVDSDTEGHSHEFDSEDEEYMGKTDSDTEDSDSQVSLYDSDYEEVWDWIVNLPPETVNSVRSAAAQSVGVEVPIGEGFFIAAGGNVRAASASRNHLPSSVADFSDEDGDSEDLDTPTKSDEEGTQRKKHPKFKMPEDEGKVKSNKLADTPTSGAPRWCCHN